MKHIFKPGAIVKITDDIPCEESWNRIGKVLKPIVHGGFYWDYEVITYVGTNLTKIPFSSFELKLHSEQVDDFF
jgi:hypothetical protein